MFNRPGLVCRTPPWTLGLLVRVCIIGDHTRVRSVARCTSMLSAANLLSRRTAGRLEYYAPSYIGWHPRRREQKYKERQASHRCNHIFNLAVWPAQAFQLALPVVSAFRVPTLETLNVIRILASYEELHFCRFGLLGSSIGPSRHHTHSRYNRISSLAFAFAVFDDLQPSNAKIPLHPGKAAGTVA